MDIGSEGELGLPSSILFHSRHTNFIEKGMNSSLSGYRLNARADMDLLP